MSEKPSTVAGYPPDQVARVKATCLYLATKLGDLTDDLIVVGGLVPSLLIDQEHLPDDVSPHVGTLDLDLGLAFALVGEHRYETLAERLRKAGFRADEKDGRTIRQRWRIGEPAVTVDFLIEPEDAESKAGRLFPLDRDWAAIIAPGLHLAFLDNRMITLEGRTITGEKARREVRVCDAGAYVALKALAFHIRGENKDAYDLYYMLRNYGRSIEDVVAHFVPLLPDKTALRAVEYLKLDFLDPEAIGPMRVAQFLYGRSDVDLQADVAGFVGEFLRQTEAL